VVVELLPEAQWRGPSARLPRGAQKPGAGRVVPAATDGAADGARRQKGGGDAASDADDDDDADKPASEEEDVAGVFQVCQLFSWH
jgi:hypothetical protein